VPGRGLPWPAAAALCVLVIGPATGLALEPLARAVAGARLAARIAATVGVMLVIQAAGVLVFGQTEVRQVPRFLPARGFHAGQTLVGWADVVTFAVAVVATAGLSVTLHLTRAGVAMRAVVDDPDLSARIRS
jgi:branched-subunit amino acid ABC-type transport system permease component